MSFDNGSAFPSDALGDEARSVDRLRRSQQVPRSLASGAIGRGEELGELRDLIRQISHLVSDDIGSEVFDCRVERLRVEEVAQDWSNASGAKPVDFLRRPGHSRNDMSFS